MNKRIENIFEIVRSKLIEGSAATDEKKRKLLLKGPKGGASFRDAGTREVRQGRKDRRLAFEPGEREWVARFKSRRGET